MPISSRGFLEKTFFWVTVKNVWCWQCAQTNALEILMNCKNAIFSCFLDPIANSNEFASFYLSQCVFLRKSWFFIFFYVFDDMSLICYASQQIWATGLKKSSFLTQVFKKTFDGCYTDPRGPLFFCRFFFSFQCQKKQIPKKLVLKP